mmetsp:Transcript_91075/g.253589  ORF Transcript_91075/g.253589 Transcript_91075/m.253589 type:complete len:276 (+) Transcript_91075:783-1610(+)
MQRGGQREQRDRALHRHAQRALHDEAERGHGRHQHHQAHGPDLGQHDLARRDRHHQQVLDGAVLALADQRGAGQDDGEHGDVVDDLHQRTEPGVLQVGVEAHAHRQVDRWRGAAAVPQHETVDLGRDDLLHIAAAGEGLAHPRRVDIELQPRLAPGQHVALEAGRDDEHEGVVAAVHAGVDLAGRDQFGAAKPRRVEALGQSRRQRRGVFVHDGNGRMPQALGHGGGGGVDGEAEGVDDQHQHHRVAPEAPQLFDAEAVDVGEVKAGHVGHSVRC